MIAIGTKSPEMINNCARSVLLTVGILLSIHGEYYKKKKSAILVTRIVNLGT